MTGPIPGRLVSVSVGTDQSVAVRVRRQASAAAQQGVRFDQVVIGDAAPESDCISVLADLAARADVIGILLQHPLPRHLRSARIESAIPCAKRLTGSAAIPERMIADLHTRMANA